MTYFTVQEAERLIPELEELFEALIRVRGQVDEKHALVKKLEAGKSKPEDLALARGQLEYLVGNLKDGLSKVEELGAIPKGLDPCLVDFPSRLKGQEVYLCWKLGEKKISSYHGTQEGFAARKPLPKGA